MSGEEGEFLPPSATGLDREGFPFELSPDGSVKVQRHLEERRNNEIWESCVAYWAKSGKPLFDPPRDFETHIAWTGQRNFAVFSGQAFAQGVIRFDVDVDAGCATVVRTGKTFLLKDADRGIREAYEDYLKTLPPAPPVPHATVSDPVQGRHTDWRTLLLGIAMALAFVATVALGSYFWHELNPPEQRYSPKPDIKPVEV